MRVVLATSNKGKVREIKKFLNEVEVVPYSELIEPFEIVEDGKSFKDNAIIKTKAIIQKLPDEIILSDDSGISVEALNWAPGIYSARYGGDNPSDKDNLNKLLSELKKSGKSSSCAYYTSCMALGFKGDIYTTHGFMYGKVIDRAIGDNGFGYDPIFIPDGFNQTLGEIEDELKINISHRAKALRLIEQILGTLRRG